MKKKTGKLKKIKNNKKKYVDFLLLMKLVLIKTIN